MSLNNWLANGKKKNGATKVVSDDNISMSSDEDAAPAPAPKAKPATDKNNKRLSVERIYQKKSQLEHILLRPDSYIGSVETVTEKQWVYDDTSESMVQRELTYVPGLYKIFDEILVNAADNKVRDPNMSCIKITINPEANEIKVWNNGKGIPVVEHKDENMFVPTMIFGHLLTSSNYNDEEEKVTGGRNGYGAKLANIFSTKFTVETQCKEQGGKHFKQSWADNMTKALAPKTTDYRGKDDFTCISFSPDLPKFKMATLDSDIVALLSRRAYDIAGTTPGLAVFLNGKKIAIKTFKDYVNLYTKTYKDEDGKNLAVVYEQCGARWHVAAAASDKGFQHVSFVNSIATTKGGRHIDHVTELLCKQLIEVVKKKDKKGSNINIKPFQIKNHMWIFVSCQIVNPTFDSQTKENMTLQLKSFGSKCEISDKFSGQVAKCGIVEGIMQWMKFKQQTQLQKASSGAKHSKLKGIPKLDDANDAGTKNSGDCTLILTEGDSAKALAVAGLGIIGRDRYGVFPLKGKLLNVREATHKQVMDNAEITNLCKIIGLNYSKKYEDQNDIRNLRYGKIMIMADQDHDGSHIKGLVINFIHHNWPNLLKYNFVEEFITPIVKVMKGKEEKSFFSLPEFEEWKLTTANWMTWKAKYYKGLGTSTSKEAKEYFSDMGKHRVPFKYQGAEDDSAITLAFSKTKINERKEWLTNFMQERARRKEMGLGEAFLYGSGTTHVTFSEFINKEFVQFSNSDNERSLPSAIDGFKPGQRKVLFTCIKRNITKELKVAQLAGSVAEKSAYHHGEMSLMSTIIGMAQNFVGSNNINLLVPCGQFGTRLHGGKDAASARYIFTHMSQLTRLIFHPSDDALLDYIRDDNMMVEPEYYVPVIPMVLVNGAEGIGTGWSTRVPNYNPREIIANLRRMIRGEDPEPMVPWFKNFKGSFESLGGSSYMVNGEISVLEEESNASKIEITELPIRIWTQNYKETVIEPMVHGTEKTKPVLTDYKEYHTDATVKFLVNLSRDTLYQAETEGIHKFFKIQTPLTCNSMVLFNKNHEIVKYDLPDTILREFYDVRLHYYDLRKKYLEGELSAVSLKLSNQARFILEKIEGKLVIENKKRLKMIETLVDRGYDPDPVKKWKSQQKSNLDQVALDQNESDQEDNAEEPEKAEASDFDYLMSMPMWSLTLEKKEALLKQRDQKKQELTVLRGKSLKDLWIEDLDALAKKLDEVEEEERRMEAEGNAGAKKKKDPKGRGAGKAWSQKALLATKPSPIGRKIQPKIAAEYLEKKMKQAKSDVNKKERKMKKEAKSAEQQVEEELHNESMDLGLTARLGLSDEKKAKKEKKPRAPKEPGTGKSPKKGKKKNPWETDSEEEEVNRYLSFESSGEETDEDDVLPAKKPAASSTRGAPKTNGNHHADDDGKSDDEEDDEDSKRPSSTLASAPTSAPASAPTSAPASAPASDDDDDSIDLPSFPNLNGKEKKEPEKSKPEPKKRKLGPNLAPSKDAKKSKKDKKDPWDSSDEEAGGNSDDDDSDDDVKGKKKEDKSEEKDMDALFDAAKKITPPAKNPPTKKPSKFLSSEDESDSEFTSKPAKSSKPPKAPKDAKAPKVPKEPKEAKATKAPKEPKEPKAPKPKAAKAPKPKAKKPTWDSGSEDEDDFVAKKKPLGKKKAAYSDESDAEMDSPPPAAPRGRAGRGAAQKVKYNFSDDDDDDGGDSDF